MSVEIIKKLNMRIDLLSECGRLSFLLSILGKCDPFLFPPGNIQLY